MYHHEEAFSLFSVSPTPGHIMGWAFVLAGLFLAVMSLRLFRAANRLGRLNRDPIRDDWWYRQLRDNDEDPESPFADLLRDELPPEHPSALIPAVQEATCSPVSETTAIPIADILKKHDEEWEAFKASWDEKHPVVVEASEA